jgi:hypothetical protein
MAYSFNGSNQRLVMGNIYGNSPAEITMSIWGRANGTNTSRSLWANTLGNSLLFRFFSNASSQAQFTYRDSTFTTQASIIRAGALADLTWYHWCVTVSAADGARFYIDGVSAGTDATVSMANNNPAISSIGASDASGVGTWQNHWSGDAAEAGIWDKVLTPEEVISLSKGMTCDKVRPQSLVFYAPLVRDLQDVRGGLTITNNNTATVATHPRVYA